MPSYYIYLISSLPMLNFALKPPISFKQFIQMCQGLIPEEDIETLKKTSSPGEYISNNLPQALKKWYAFDIALRNELVKVRSSRKHIEPTKYLRGEGYVEPDIVHLAMNAVRNPSILDAERMLDQERWRILDGLSVGHYFDIDFLIVYAHKLLILERWERIRLADKSKALEAVLQKDSKQ